MQIVKFPILNEFFLNGRVKHIALHQSISEKFEKFDYFGNLMFTSFLKHLI